MRRLRCKPGLIYIPLVSLLRKICQEGPLRLKVVVLEHRYFLVLLVGLFIVLRRRLYEYHVQIELTWEE